MIGTFVAEPSSKELGSLTISLPRILEFDAIRISSSPTNSGFAPDAVLSPYGPLRPPPYTLL
jgi:hypothetical protein